MIMELLPFRGKRMIPKCIVLTVCCIVFVYYLSIFRKTSFTAPPATGVPVDWRHLPRRPQFPKHTPLPLPLHSTTPSTEVKHGQLDLQKTGGKGEWQQNAPFFQTNGAVMTDAASIDRLYKQLRIVTAFSENHYEEALGFIGTVQREMPDKKVLVYDLGIEPPTLRKVKRLCQVELRTFPFQDFPPHVRNLHTYAWKVIIINMTLHEFGAIFWADSSVRFKQSLRHVIPYATRHHGYMTHFHAFDIRGLQDTARGHIYHFTYPKMFPALGIRRTEYFASVNATPHAAANRQLLVANPYLQENLVRPLLECALLPACIAPPAARLGKHRFDASALSLLLYKNMRFEWTAKNNDNDVFDRAIEIHRWVVDWHLARRCT